eukprot:scaffold4972_cov143-Skeletonema_marinoi.AAC.1
MGHLNLRIDIFTALDTIWWMNEEVTSIQIGPHQVTYDVAAWPIRSLYVNQPCYSVVGDLMRPNLGGRKQHSSTISYLTL